MNSAPRRLLSLLAGAILLSAFAIALPATANAAPATDWNNYERITLTKSVGEPVDMAILPDKRILHTARDGDVRLTDPGTGVTKVVNTIPVYANSEDGLQTIHLDPDFEENNWVYVYYAPPLDTPSGSAPNRLPEGEDESFWDTWEGNNRLSRFTWDEQAGALDLSSEQTIIEVETQRGQCCHVAGDIAFDSEGDLYLSTGDNTPASAPGANGYAPNNDAPGYNPGYDARRSAGNTNDLRGKILRITVQEDGSYTVPEGNLFEPGTEGTRPEIYVMGVRNPFRMTVDPETDALMWGDYGPDAGTADPDRGPMGYVEWQSTSEPLNAGWPYCHGPNAEYNEWDFATGTPGEFFDCDAPVNNSHWNTGLTDIPVPATEPQLWYGDSDDDQPWPELTAFGGGGQGPMGGPVYHYDADNPAPGKFPEHWDGKAFFGEFSQNYLAALTVDGPDGSVSQIENVLPNDHLDSIAAPPWRGIMDMEFGPDGSLYVLEYGTGFFTENPDAGLYRIDYAEGNKTPAGQFTATPSSGQPPLTVEFDASASTDPEGDELTYEWDFTGDGEFTATGPTATHTYEEKGEYFPRLRVTDTSGKFSLVSDTVVVGNTAPEVTLTTPVDGGFFDWGDPVAFDSTITDPEDGDAVDCARAAWQFGIGHDSHAHPGATGEGCSGTIPTPSDSDHGETENTYGVFLLTYTDGGAEGVPAATGEASLYLTPKLREAEWAGELSGGEIVDDSGASGQRKVGSLAEGDWISFDRFNFTGISGVTLRAASEAGGTVSLRWNAPDGPVIGEIPVDATGGAGDYVSASTFLGDTSGETGTLYVTTTGGVDLDSLLFRGHGVAEPAAAGDGLDALATAVADADLDRRVEKRLANKVDVAVRHHDGGRAEPAVAQLEEFQDMARADVPDSALAEELFWKAQGVIESLGD
ncbi:glucose/arabinose dehydrogenase [Spinactinospora alkalitolerans]|uniref:Glucose/arabinose dehydrogenase n=1 Tax=Spinactinospora alkalitolerans TaxID=687207 RepID=A0A852TS17_9ACTN|nr:PQQ-dependent sugar dehydrogenase [Spinactinospora alkalitolerans]NYE46381.1 glucose/arabinose dehydrogenase [Spinactinospora alkalitolerans]